MTKHESISLGGRGELMAATRILQELPVVGRRGLMEPVAECVALLLSQGGTIETASDFLISAGKEAVRNGEIINRFWFTDQKYNPPVEKKARVPKIAAPPAPAQRSAEETTAYEMWESMSEEYRKANPWRAQ